LEATVADYAIRAEGLAKSFKRTPALRGIDLAVPPGTVCALLGRNGAGKTTAVRILTTLLRPDAGTAEVAGFDVLRAPAEVRARIGVAGQGATVDELLTGRQNLRIVGQLTHLPAAVARRRADELLEQFGLTEAAGRLVRGYSGGMRRRLDLAASVLAGPPVLFLDEPTTGLDPVSRAQVWASVRELVSGSATTVLLTSQYLEEAEYLADEVVVLSDGRVAATGTPGQLRASVGAARIRVVLHDGAAVTPAGLRELLGDGAQADGRTLTVPAPDGLVSLAGVVRRLGPVSADVADVALQRPSLEEAFTMFTETGGTGGTGGDGPPPGRDDLQAQSELAGAGAR
jgi:ABC-2 type transport system ATP-binding protein